MVVVLRVFEYNGYGPVRCVGPGTRAADNRGGHRAKVGKRNLVTVTIFEIFNNPLCVPSAERTSRVEQLDPGRAIGKILDRGDTRSRRRSMNSGSDDVSSGDVEVGEIVRVVGVPLVPCYLRKG